MAVAKLRAKLTALRQQSTLVRQRAPSPQTPLEAIALAAWDRADALAEALERAVTPPEVIPCCSILSRVFFEDYITFIYVAKYPQPRIDQLRASEIRQYKRNQRHPWAREHNIEPLPPEAHEFFRRRREAERQAEEKAKEQYGEQGRHRIAVDDYACLPSFWKRLKAVGGSEMYLVYAVESRNAVHFGLMALFNILEVVPSLFSAVALYRRILRAVTAATHLGDSIPPDPDESVP